MLLALCRRMVPEGSLAEDAAQEAVLLALSDLHRLRDPERFGSWLAGIGLNVCRHWLRLRRQSPWSWHAMLGGQAVLDTPDLGPTTSELVEERELASLVRRAVAGLPDGQRAAVVLFYGHGLGHRESAATLGITVGSVKTRLHKARENLRRELVQLWEELDMNAPDTTRVAMHIVGVHRTVEPDEAGSERHVVVLAERDGHRRLPIWIGPFEASAIALSLESVELPRPGPWQLAAKLLEASGTGVREVTINRISDGTFFAEVYLDGGAAEGAVDARPSDALSLALVTGAPITVAVRVLEAVAIQERSRPGQAPAAVFERTEAGTADIVREALARIEASSPGQGGTTPG